MGIDLEGLSNWIDVAPAGRSVVAFLLLLPALIAASALGRARARAWGRLTLVASWSARVACFALIGASMAQAAMYLTHAAFFDPYEASVASVSGLVGQGAPLFHRMGDPVRYVQMGYGPALYLIDYAFARAFGLTLQSCKLAGVTSFALALGLMARAMRRPDARFALTCPQALAASAALALALDYFSYFAFWTRADPHLVLATVAGVWALEERRLSPRAKALALGVASGIALDLKFTAGLYFVPLFVVALFDLGARGVLTALAACIATAAMPFLLPSVSLRNHLYWLRQLSRQGLDGVDTVEFHAERALFYSLPLVVSWMGTAMLRARRVRGRWLISLALPGGTPSDRQNAHFLSIVGSFALLVLVASKPGASEHHFMPFFPVIIHAVVRMAPRAARAVDVRPLAALAMGLVLFTADWTKQTSLWALHNETRATSLATAREITSFLAAHPGKTVEMGEGASLGPGYYRPLLVFAKMPYAVDVGTLMDLGSIGAGQLPDALVDRVAHCGVDYILIGKGSPPFQLRSVYYGQAAYDLSYVEAFQKSYELRESLEFYDVYACREPPLASAAPPVKRSSAKLLAEESGADYR
jgi:hypothetical protein